MKTIAKQPNINYIERKIFWGLFALLVIFAVSYGYFVNQTILNIVARENIEEKTMTLNSEISEMEFDYIALKNDVNIDYAYSIGFVDVENVKFASRRLPVTALSVETNR